MKSVNYSHLVSPLIEALKELYGQFKALFSGDVKQNRKIASIERENKEIRLENEQIKAENQEIKSENREIKKENQEIKAVLCEIHPSASFCKNK
jgi:regulator of replication initiation timing